MPEKYFGTPTGKDTHGQIAVLQDGRVIAYGKNHIEGDLFTNGTACQFINVRVPDLRMIEYVLNVQFHTTPLACTGITHINKEITGNVVGMTLSAHIAAAGTTLTVEVIAIGPP
ncbi:unnamed protein product [marine sediment metagenome]|uniref:Uncharacterized protein n=1 Tax=marine sediment metagenome TaxID=412755 RepID=X1JQU1_9ZZZZ